MLGPQGKLLTGAQTDLSASHLTTEENNVRLSLTAANRWLMQESRTVKSTFLNLLEVLKDKPVMAPTLITQEEAEARMTARQVVHKYETGLASGSKELTNLEDVAVIVDRLATGVRGGGAYRNVVYRVPRAREFADRIVELLEWKDSGQLVVDTSHQPGMGGVKEKIVASRVSPDVETVEP